jgi:hypothetical protein
MQVFLRCAPITSTNFEKVLKKSLKKSSREGLLIRESRDILFGVASVGAAPHHANRIQRVIYITLHCRLINESQGEFDPGSG